MAEPGTLKIGDMVTHPTWPEGTTATVVGVCSMSYHPNMAKPNYKEFVVELDRPVHAVGGGVGIGGVQLSKAELDLDKEWMEAGLEKV